MKKIILFSFFITLFLNNNISAQGFDLQLYQEFLQSHQNMQTQDLLQMYPAGIFSGNINSPYDNVFYFDSIDAKYNLTGYEKSLIHNNGFMVTQRLSQPSFGQILLDIHHNDLPVFVSTDAILYAYHVSYDRILRDVELGYLISKVEGMLMQLRNSFPQLVSEYSSTPGMVQSLMDADLYITVGLKLIGQNQDPYYSQNIVKVNSAVSLAMTAEGFSSDTLFSSECVTHDWSQFKPRGHYDSDQFPELRNYFRTMMWFGRIEIYLATNGIMDPFCLPQTFEDVRRQIIDANLIYELFDLANVNSDYEDIEDILKFFVGDQDNVTLDNLGYLRDAVQITETTQLLDSLKILEYQDTLANQSFAYQLILSQLLCGDPFSPDSIVPASSFLLFGQRYVDDSYVTASVVWDRTLTCRLFPKALDPMFALGNNAAAQLLQSELDTYHYATNLAALRYLFDSFPTTYWDNSMYKRWLYFLKALNPPEDRGNLPPFMTTAAYWQEKLNTQLSSWAELRHDNLLYAKQSYTGIPICSYPYSYVEPFPELYGALKNAGEAGYNFFLNSDFLDPYLKQQILDYFTNLQFTSDTLRSISEKELNNTPLSSEETAFLKNMMFDYETYTGIAYDGWYPKIIFEDEAHDWEGLMSANYVVADIHTTPADCDLNMIGAVTHVGTGPVDMGVFIAKLPGGEDCAFIGPTMSYREYVSTNFLRLTDDEWSSQYLFSSLRPDWVNLYLADSTGNSRGEGGTLITSVKPDNRTNKISDYLTVANYPNPFNPVTIISYSVPYDLTNQNAELIVYDLQGQIVKHLVNQVLPAGNYLTKWNGDNDGGAPVSSGIYFYRLKVGDRQAIGKMNLIK
ncbi:MAG TPA: DUF3160 domain-containing protein [Ignavibacteriaceae bacterium]|nr:DUF3160 domain-containing protein [Ignavibacteriaceae bacterium]